MKLTKIELKKYFKHPATYIVSALLVLVMLVSIMIYKPTLASDTSITSLYESYDINVNDYNAVYDYFNDNIYQQHSKIAFSDLLYNSNTYLEEHDPSNKDNDTLLKLNTIVAEIETLLNNPTDYNTAASTIKTKLANFSSIYTEATNTMQESFIAVMTKSTKEGLKTTIDNALLVLSSGAAATQINDLKTSNLVGNLKNNLKGFKNFLPTPTDFKTAKDYYNKAIKITQTLDTKLAALPTTNGNVNTLLNYINEYYKVVFDSYYVITNQIKVSAVYTIGETEASNYLGLGNINTYEYKEKVTKHKYLLDYYEKNGSYLEFIEPINIAFTDVYNVNMADYMGFVLTLCAFVIIVSISIMGAISVNSEFVSGTMRMIATKPFKKSKIITSKISATLLYGLILLILSFIVSFIMGGIAYGFATPAVLLIINASVALECNVIIELLIFLLTLIIQVVLFASLAVLLSTIINNKIVAATISCILYFVSIVFNIVNVNIAFLPFTNINLWKYFGGSFLLNDNKNFFAMLFNSTPIATNTIILNIISFILFTIIAQIVTFIIFKKKEIK